MIDAADLSWIAENSVEIIAGTGEALTRRRLVTAPTPAGFDADFGEMADKAAEAFLDVAVTGKVFFQPSEKQWRTEFGAGEWSGAIVHLALTDDVVVGDRLVIRGTEYQVMERSEAALRGYNSFRVGKR